MDKIMINIKGHFVGYLYLYLFIYYGYYILYYILWIVKEIKQYQEKWLQHVQRMDTKIIPKQALQYTRKPKGRRNFGRPRKRWRDQFHFEDQGTGNTPSPS